MKTLAKKIYWLGYASTRAALVLYCILYATTAAVAGGPEYASSKSKEVIHKMIEAHGGMENWRSAPAVSFHSHLKVDFGGGNWVPFWEETTVEMGSRRAYSKLPNADGTHGTIAYDGKSAWGAGNLQGISNAPPRFTAWRNFYLFNLPWMTQDEGVRLGKPTRGSLAIDSSECIMIEMSFASGTGDTPKDSYTLYIDPTTYRLRASEYSMTYSSMMRGGATFSPPSIFVWEETGEKDGLIVPTRYTVYWSKDGSVAVKDGTIDEWSFSEDFDENQLEMPPGAKPDQSQP